jgi:predicted benzoate:H+ symporter BenE
LFIGEFMDAVTAALIGSGVALFGIATAFGGVLIGQRMARNTQREQRLKDCRGEEFE